MTILKCCFADLRIIHIIISVYANSFLFSLNSRNILSNEDDQVGSGSVHFSGLDTTLKTTVDKPLELTVCSFFCVMGCQ